MRHSDAHKCPEGVRITDGPRYTLRRVPWRPDQKFYKVFDIETNLTTYHTSVETAVLCGIKLSTFKHRLRKKKTKTIFNDRWEIQRVPRFIFIEKTGRPWKVLQDYFWRY